jgi:transposase
VWKVNSENFHPSLLKGTVKYEKKVNAWGCYTYHGVGYLHRIEGIMDKKIYQNILKDQMLPSAKVLFPDGNYIFQQDNDPKHTSELCKDHLARKRVVQMTWRAQSPDLNPIENLWSILDCKTRDRKKQSEDELFELLQTAWHRIPTV